MESIELFGETYFGARNEAEFHQVMEWLGWKHGRDYGRIDTPVNYPCLFRVECVNSDNGEYPNVYIFSEEDIRQYAERIKNLF